LFRSYPFPETLTPLDSSPYAPNQRKAQETTVEITCEQAGPCEANITFTIERADFDRELKRALFESGKNVRMKGFRPGKVPASFLEKQFGADARRQVVENFSKEAFQQAIKEHDLKP
jgi:trigger factor